MGTDSPEGYYRTLGLKPGASLEEVKRAYRALVKVWHPDRFSQVPHLQQYALEKIQGINQAYAKLRTLQPHSSPRTSPTPLYVRAFRQSLQTRSVPTWLFALVAFVVLRLGFDYLAPVSYCMIPHKSGLLGDGIALTPSPPMGERVEVRGAPLAWNTPHPNPLPEGKGAEAEEAATGPSPPSAPAPAAQMNGYFTVGSTKAEVLAIQGPPTLANEHVWEYGGSRVYFRHGRVSRWEVWPRSPLKVKLLPAATSNGVPGYFTVGSTKDDVLAVQGTPTRLSQRVWEYDHSRVYFDGDRVTRWEEWRGSPLKARHALPEDESRWQDLR